MRKRNITIFICLFVLLFAMAVEASYPMKVKDDTDKVSMITRKPLRIVSLAPSHTEILFALGLGDRVVGRTDFCDYPVEVANIPSVGGYSEPSVETIMAVNPDLVLASFGNPQELIEQIRSFGIPVLGYDPQTIDEILVTIWEIGKVTGAEAQAIELREEMKNRVQAVTELVKGAERPKVFWEVWHDPLYTAGKDTFINDLITLAGGVNVAIDAIGPWPVYNLESLLLKNPDVYIATEDQWSGPGNIYERPAYDQIKAVQTERVYVINANNVNRPGPRLVDGLEEIVRVIHPELF
ncbi:MAG: cobalamin-binding protein [Halanaerobiales bacterium]|nr:cobalamin-binding protein [Halanaerobiales bacterium]